MPTPKFTPGAQLIPLTLTSPAFGGLNTEQGATILGKEWATVLANAVFDEAGRPASRKGWDQFATLASSGIPKRIFEYFKADGTSDIIWSTDTDIVSESGPASIKGSLTITEGNIKFVNFNDKVIAFGIGAAGVPAVKTTGNFASITVNSGTAPTGYIGTAAFGRVWGVDTDGKTVRASALLDETRWATVDGGFSVDFSKVWPAGQDNVVAIEEFDGDLIVFGSNNTVILTDGAGSALGIDPTMLYVSGTIPGLGAVSQFGISRAAGDLWVITETGIIGLRRELVQRSTPITNMSKNVQSNIIEAIQRETDLDDVTLVYSPGHAMVIANFPLAEVQYVFDTRSPLQDGAFRATSWNSPIQAIAYVRADRNLYGGLTTATDKIFEYSGYDDNGDPYIFEYKSGWLDLGQELNVYLKFVKRLTSFVFAEENVTVTHNVSYDFAAREFTFDRAAVGGGHVIEWNNFEWGINGVYSLTDASAVAGVDYAEWAASVTLRTLDANPGGSGQYIQIGIRLNTEAGNFALQQINLYAKVGRLAT